MALCSLSIGSSVAPPSRTAAMNSAPPITSASLLASRMRLPARAAASVGAQPGGADDRRHHRVDFGQRGDLARAPSAPGEHSRRQALARKRRCERARRVGIEQRGVARAEAAAQLEQRRPLPVARSAPTTAKRSGMARDDVERRCADRAGRAEHGDAARSRGRAHRDQVRARSAPPAASRRAARRCGRARRRGRAAALPLSLTPALALQQRFEQIADDRQSRQAAARARPRSPTAIGVQRPRDSRRAAASGSSSSA